MLEYLLTFIFGGITFTIATYLIMRNNKKHIEELFNYDKLTIQELERLKVRISNKINSLK